MKKAKQSPPQVKATGMAPRAAESEAHDARIFRLLTIPSILVLGSVIYSNSLDCAFHFDDITNIVEASKYPDLWDFSGWWNYSKTRLVAFYSFAVNVHLHGYEVRGFHLVNLGIHLITACLVWWLSLLICSSPALKDHKVNQYKYPIAFFTALLFVSHPLATQSVTYIVQRMSALVALFYVASMAFYLKARMAEIRPLFKYIFFAASLISGLLALMTKQNAYTLPFALVLVEFFFVRKTIASLSITNRRILFILAGLAGFLLFTFSQFSKGIFKAIPPVQGTDYTITPVNYLLTQFSVILKYIQLLVLPVNQALDYDYPISSGLLEPRTFISLLVLIGMLLYAFKVFDKNRILSFGIFWFLLTLSIESSIIPLRDLIFEHRTYLPSFGFFLAFTAIVYPFLLEKSKVLVYGFFMLLAGIYSVSTYQRNEVWKTPLSLWTDNVKKQPTKSRAVFYKGMTLSKANQYDKAIAEYDKAIALSPKYAKAYYNRGIAYGKKGNIAKAIENYNQAIQYDPRYTEAFVNRGNAFSSLKQYDKAVEDYNQVIAIEKNFLLAYYNRANAFRALGKTTEALEDYATVLRLNKNYAAAAFNRGTIFLNLKQWDSAIAEFSLAIQLKPKYKEAFVNRGIAYLNSNQVEKAIEEYDRALQIDPSFDIAINNRKAALIKLQAKTK
jgi:protein O-mannosyl-transferase